MLTFIFLMLLYIKEHHQLFLLLIIFHRCKALCICCCDITTHAWAFPHNCIIAIQHNHVAFGGGKTHFWNRSRRDDVEQACWYPAEYLIKRIDHFFERWSDLIEFREKTPLFFRTGIVPYWHSHCFLKLVSPDSHREEKKINFLNYVFRTSESTNW